MFLFPFLIEPFQKYHLKTNICHLSYRCNIETKYVLQLIETILTLHSLPHNRSSRSRFALVRLPADTRQAPQLRRCQLSYYVDDDVSDKGNNKSLSPSTVLVGVAIQRDQVSIIEKGQQL